MLKIIWLWDHLIFNMGIPLLVRRHLYIETVPRILSWSLQFILIITTVDSCYTKAGHQSESPQKISYVLTAGLSYVVSIASVLKIEHIISSFARNRIFLANKANTLAADILDTDVFRSSAATSNRSWSSMGEDFTDPQNLISEIWRKHIYEFSWTMVRETRLCHVWWCTQLPHRRAKLSSTIKQCSAHKSAVSGFVVD